MPINTDATKCALILANGSSLVVFHSCADICKIMDACTDDSMAQFKTEDGVLHVKPANITAIQDFSGKA